MANDANAAFILRDQEHLIHPLHSPAAHVGGKVWVRGEGAELIDANGDRYIDGLSGLWNNTAGHGCRELVDAAAAQMAELPYASGYSGSTNPRAIELAETARRDHLPERQPLLLHLRRRRVERQQLQDGPLLLEAPRQAGQDQGHLAPVGLPRGDPRRDVRDRDHRVLADVRAPGAGLRPHSVSLPLPLRGAGRREPGHRGRERARAGDPPGRAGHGGHVPRGAGPGGGRRDRPAGRLLPPHPRDLRPVRRAVRLRRGDHRLRAHGKDVRPRALGREAGHDPVREGDHLGVLPAWRHRDQRRDRGCHGRRGYPLDARLHVQRPPGRLRHRGRDARRHRAGRIPGDGRGQGQAACSST